jgi:hypothetical protein
LKLKLSREPNNTNENKKKTKIFSGEKIHERRNTRNDTTTRRDERTVMEVWKNNLLHIMNEIRITRLSV